MRHYGFIVSVVVLALVLIASATPVQGQTYQVLYNFGSNAGDPFQPTYTGAIAQGRDGNVYTTVQGGGAGSCGAVVKVTPGGSLTVIHNFNTNPLDGCIPQGGLTLGTDGNFYGTTSQGGNPCCQGSVYKVTPNGTVTLLYSFTGGNDGAYPYAPPIQGTDGNWYGTTSSGGMSGQGTIYKMTPAGALTTIYQFDGGIHGGQPRAPLVQGSDGNFYGTTIYGGAIGYGEIFKITSTGALTVLYSFDNTHGGYPVSPLIQGTDGNFYGTAQDYGSLGGGVAFKVSSSGSFTVLHNMNGTTDGEVPTAGLVQASDGNLYGVNGSIISGGNSGTFFTVTTKGAFSVVHSFDGTTGAAPDVTPLQHTNGTFFGDTYEGGTGSTASCTVGSCGVFYSLNANLPAFINLLPYSGKVGSKVGILGQGFSNSSIVKFNGVQATSISVTGTTFIQATVPAGASDGYVTVTTGATLKSLEKFIVHNSWATGAAMPTPVKSAAVGLANSKIYVVGGVNAAGTVVATNQLYNPATNTWNTAASFPTAIYAAASAVVQNILYVIGGTTTGTNVTNTVWAYNPATNAWSSKSSMPTARVAATAVVENNIIYVIGGEDASFNSLATVESYNPATNSWSAKASLPVAKAFLSAGLLGTTIMAAGGQTGVGVLTGDNEAYAASTNTWTSKTSDPTARGRACAGAINGQLYLAGGYNGGTAGTPALSLNEAFSISKNAWTALASMPQATQAAGSAVYGNQLYCFGGQATQGGPAIGNVQIYQP